MVTFLSLHALAARRGDGLRPELVELFKRLSGVPEATLASGESGHRYNSAVRGGPDPFAKGPARDAETDFASVPRIRNVK